MRSNRTLSGCASVERLESRRLLSAAPVPVMAAMTPVRAAAHVHPHPTYPNVLGTFNGTYATTKGQTGQVIFTISSEGKTGKIAGTLTIVGTGTLGISGTVSLKGKFAVHGSAGHFSITIGGAVSSGGNTLAGKFNTTSRHGSSHGTFTTSKT